MTILTSCYGDIFTKPTSLDDLNAQFKRLAMKYHPDRGGTDLEFARLSQLHEQAIDAFNAKSVWVGSQTIHIDTARSYQYNWIQDDLVGQVYAGTHSIVLTSTQEHSNLLVNANRVCDAGQTQLRSVTDPTIAQTRDLIPKFEITNDNTVLVCTKSPQFHPLALVMDKYQFKTVDVAWMVGKMMHLMCFLEWAQIVHGAISVENIWVDLDHHHLALYGGWWYSRSQGQRLVALPQRSARFVQDPIANYNIDRDCVRQTILDLFRVKTAAALRMNKQVPGSVVEFLSVPFRNSGVETYREWERVRDQGFGPRKFVKFDYQLDELYPASR